MKDHLGTAAICLTYQAALPHVAALRHHRKRIVFTQGCFDLLHVGHTKYLAAARAFGDALIVAVDNDAKVRRRKGQDRPIFDELMRVELLSHLRAVDVVLLRGDDVDDGVIVSTLRPDVLIATAESPPQLEARADRDLPRVVFLPRTQHVSTTSILQRLRNSATQR